MNLHEFTSLIELLFKNNNIDYRLHPNNQKNEISIECPFCKKEHNYDGKRKLYIGIYHNDKNKIESKFICFRCERKGTLNYLLEALNLKKQFIFLLSKNNNNIIDSYKNINISSILNKENILNKDIFLSYKKYEIKNFQYYNGISYFEDRGFPADFLIKKNIIFITTKIDYFSKKYFGYALIPSHDFTNFTGRNFMIDGVDEKYINKKRYLLYNSSIDDYFGDIINPEDKNIYIVEGPIDYLKLNLFNYNSIAVTGKSKLFSFLKSNIANEFFSKGYKFIIIFDADIDFFDEQNYIKYMKEKLITDNCLFLHMGISKFKDTGDINKKEDFENLLKKIRPFDKISINEIKLLILKQRMKK